MNKITAKMVAALLPKREKASHKGDFGRVLVVAGSRSMCGAGFLCALSALRVGAGLVAWALPKSMQPSFAAALPEVITLPLEETSNGFLAATAKKELQDFCTHFRPSVLACGCGMGDSPLLKFILEKTQIPLVLDADGLNFLANHSKISIAQERPCIFTPHPGEMARLLGSPVAGNETERIMQVQSCCKKYGKLAILKGDGTLVAQEKKIWKNTSGSPALAKGGSGDVLTGIIAGLWAQLATAKRFDISAREAALCGVYLHGLAGELAGKEKTVYSVLAREVVEKIPTAISQILQAGRKL